MIPSLLHVSYDISGAAAKLMDSDSGFSKLCHEVRSNLCLAAHNGERLEPPIAKDIYGTLLFLDVLENRFDDAETDIAQLRSLSEKPPVRLTTHIATYSIVQAMRRGGLPSVLRSHFENVIADLPWEVVGSEIRRLSADLEILSRAFIDGLVEANCKEIHASGEPLGHETAAFLIRMRFYRDVMLRFRDDLRDVLEDNISTKGAPAGVNRRSGSGTLDAAHNFSPVVIGIWDSGVDLDHFASRMATSGGRSSIAWDHHGQRTDGALPFLSREQLSKLPELIDLVRGLGETRVGTRSQYSERFAREIASLKSDEVTPFLEELELIADYVHGTHLAGVAIEGNPFAKLLSVRLTWEHRFTTEASFDLNRLRVQANLYRESLRFLRDGGARVINVSWNRSPSLYASAATSVSPEINPRRLFDRDRDQLHQLMANSGEVLFVVAAGNSDQSVARSELFPATFELPNVIVAGAVDQMGNMAAFTNYGAARMVYAEGCDILSCAPGGVPLTLSGTSVAAAKVTSLAAKLQAVRPELTPSEIVEHVMLTGLVGPDGTRSIDVNRALALI
jgi:hypothetical protein